MACGTSSFLSWCPSTPPRRSDHRSAGSLLNLGPILRLGTLQSSSQHNAGQVLGAARISKCKQCSRVQTQIRMGSKTPPKSLEKRPEAANIGIRSEVEAPFRALRLVLFGFFAVSASVGALIATTQLAAALANSPRALPLADVAQSLGIDLAAAGTFAFFLRRDLQARDKQIARLTRKERLGALPLSLANGRRVTVAQLRSFSRVVIAAGTPEQVAAALKAAEPLREQLLERGVLVVPLPIFQGDSAAATNGTASDTTSSSGSSSSSDDLRWKATPLRLELWRTWFDEQAALANAKSGNGLYISLRLDGRVRGSGQGPPPWQRLIAQLALLAGEGAWKGFFDGFDGRV